MNQSTPKPAQGYTFLEHTTDALIEAWGRSIAEAFAQAGKALFDTMLYVQKVNPVNHERAQVTGHDEKELLYNWLEDLLLRFEINSMTYSTFQVSRIVQNQIGFSLQAEIRGEPYNRSKHGSKTEVKGVTYHLMEIAKTPTEARVQFLLDL